MFRAIIQISRTFTGRTQCVDEARRNLTRKRPAALARLELTFLDVAIVAAPKNLVVWAQDQLPEDDAWVLSGAVEASAHVLLTGNTRHFGSMMTRSDLPLRVRTVRAYLDELISAGRLSASPAG